MLGGQGGGAFTSLGTATGAVEPGSVVIDDLDGDLVPDVVSWRNGSGARVHRNLLLD